MVEIEHGERIEALAAVSRSLVRRGKDGFSIVRDYHPHIQGNHEGNGPSAILKKFFVGFPSWRR
jgi:hypothetical protein